MMRFRRPLVGAVAALLLALPASMIVAQDGSPTPESLAPDPVAVLAGSDFAGIFPTELGGLPWDELAVQVGQGDLEVQDAEELTEFGTLLETLGATIDDVTTVTASRISEDFTEFTLVLAFRVAGVDADQMLEALLPEFANDLTQPMQEEGQVSGKDVIVMYDMADDSFFGEAQPFHFYAGGDIVRVVSASEPLLTEAFDKLP